jgi:hypothetical protein
MTEVGGYALVDAVIRCDSVCFGADGMKVALLEGCEIEMHAIIGAKGYCTCFIL